MSVSNLFGPNNIILERYLGDYLGGETGPAGPDGIPGTGIPQLGPTGPAGPGGFSGIQLGPTGPQGNPGVAGAVAYVTGDPFNIEILDGQVFQFNGTFRGNTSGFVWNPNATFPANPGAPPGTSFTLQFIGTYLITVSGGIKLGNTDGNVYSTLIFALNNQKIPQSKITLMATVDTITNSGSPDMCFYKKFIITTTALNSVLLFINDVPDSQPCIQSAVAMAINFRQLK